MPVSVLADAGHFTNFPSGADSTIEQIAQRQIDHAGFFGGFQALEGIISGRGLIGAQTGCFEPLKGIWFFGSEWLSVLGVGQQVFATSRQRFMLLLMLDVVKLLTHIS